LHTPCLPSLRPFQLRMSTTVPSPCLYLLTVLGFTQHGRRILKPLSYWLSHFSWSCEYFQRSWETSSLTYLQAPYAMLISSPRWIMRSLGSMLSVRFDLGLNFSIQSNLDSWNRTKRTPHIAGCPRSIHSSSCLSFDCNWACILCPSPRRSVWVRSPRYHY